MLSLRLSQTQEQQAQQSSPRTPRPHSQAPRERGEGRTGNIPSDTVFIGKKPLMAYATAVMMHFNTGAKQLTVKARGKAISHAVDVIEVVRRRFFEGKLNIKDVQIGSEVLGEEGQTRNVSTIEITLERNE